MKFTHIIEALYHQPLAITADGFKTIDAIARPVILEGKRPETDFFGAPMPQMAIESGVAIIPVFGPLLQHAALMDKQCGATSYDDIREDLETCANRGVECAIVNINSPGGQVAGCLEMAEFIAEFQAETKIPVYAFTDTQMCSAAYFLAAGCDQIFATRSSLVGSIGVIMGFVDSSKAYEVEGLKAMVFTSGKYKGTSSEGTPCTPEQAEYVQGLVDSCFAQFAQHVTTHRDAIQMDSMQGQCFTGDQALEAGLIDDCVNNIQDLTEFLSDE